MSRSALENEHVLLLQPQNQLRYDLLRSWSFFVLRKSLLLLFAACVCVFLVCGAAAVVKKLTPHHAFSLAFLVCRVRFGGRTEERDADEEERR